MKEDSTVSSIEKVTPTDVTVKNADGTKTVAPATMLSKDALGNLVLNKAAIAAKGALGATPAPQQKPITPGQKVNVVTDAVEQERLKRLAGL